jgi:hypothetical protein
MITLVFEAYGALCPFALVVFLVWASAAKLRPDLDEEHLDLAELEKLVRSEPPDKAITIEPPIIEEPSSPPSGKPEQASEPEGPDLFHVYKSVESPPTVQGKVIKASLRMPRGRKLAELTCKYPS